MPLMQNVVEGYSILRAGTNVQTRSHIFTFYRNDNKLQSLPVSLLMLGYFVAKQMLEV
jgi:hypothetical protein